MKKQVLLLCALPLFLAIGCGSDKNSNEACLYETTMNLDRGNYDAVLASSCANSMQKGAAYFGKAGYSAIDVINRFSETSSSTSTTTDLNTYMNALTGKVTENTLTNMNSAKSDYCAYIGGATIDTATGQCDYCASIGGTIDTATGECINVNQTVPNYQDALFYISLVDAVKSVSLIKIVADSTGLGSLTLDCDKNNNSVPDDLDATACALLISANQPCVNEVTTTRDVSPLTFADKNGTYRGIDMTVNDLNGPSGSTTTTCPATYQKLLFQLPPIWAMAVTSNPADGMCTGSDSLPWPCPIEDQNGVTLDLVSALDQSITSAISSMGQALPPGTAADVQQSIKDIKAEACPTGTCTSADLANYLQRFSN